MAIKNINNNMNQGQNQQMNPFGPAPLVQKAAQESFALKNGGEMPPPVMQGSPNGGVAPVAPSPVNFFQNGGGINGKFDLTPDTPAPAPEYGTEGVKVTENPADVKQNDLSSLSAALSNVGGQQEPQFASDPNQRDGGFFGWLKGLAPKLRPGRREGETDDEYDRRITTNRENMAALADAMRHMGNIINTTKYAPAQQFNDPYSAMEQGYQQRKAQRQKQAALEADQAQKAAEMSLKQRAQEINDNYKKFLMGMKEGAAELNRDKFDWRKGKDERDYTYKVGRDKDKDAYQKERDKVKDEQTNKRIAIQQYNATHKGRGGGGRSGRGGSGSGGKYWFEDRNGKMRYQPNKTMWEQEYYREYGKLPEGEQTTSTSTKTIDYKTGQETTTTVRRKGSSVTSQAAQQQNAAKNARKNKPRSTNGYKNTRKLGL